MTDAPTLVLLEVSARSTSKDGNVNIFVHWLTIYSVIIFIQLKKLSKRTINIKPTTINPKLTIIQKFKAKSCTCLMADYSSHLSQISIVCVKKLGLWLSLDVSD